MGIFSPILLLLILGLVISLVLPWIHQGKLTKLEREVTLLRRQLADLTALFEKGHSAEVPDAATVGPGTAAEAPAAVLQEGPPSPAPEPAPAPQAAFAPRIAPSAASWMRWRRGINFERQFGALLPVWIGGVALAFAGFFLVKYSIERELLSEKVRVALGAAFGLGLLWAGKQARRRPGFANGRRIGQALTGAGVADLYVSIFAATTLYKLAPPSLGFAGMAAVTAVAVILSLRHGAPIALLGLVGGMVTPALIHSGNPQAGPLFIYLYFVTAGLLTAIRRERWWLLAIPTVLAAFVWMCFWLRRGVADPADAFWMGLFLIAVKFTVVAISNQQYAADVDGPSSLRKPSVILNFVAMGGASLLMGLVAAQRGFGAMSWTLFGLLAAGSIGLAFFNPRLYGFAPWFSLAVNAAMFIAWNGTPHEYAVTLALFGLLYVASGYALQLRSAHPLNWALLAVTAAIGYYLLGYFHLRHAAPFAGVPYFWGGLALGLALLATFAVQRVLRRAPGEHPLKQYLLAAYSGAGTAFVSLALTVELRSDFLALAFAGQTLAMAWINARTEIKALRIIVAALTGAFAYLMAPHVIAILNGFSPELEGTALVTDPLLARNPLLHLGLPGLLFGGSALLLRRREDTALVRTLECVSIGLFWAAAYFLMRHIYHPTGELLTGRASFFERGVTTNMFLVLALGCLWAGARFGRRGLVWSGLAVCVFAAARLVMQDFIWRNPLWSHEYVGPAPLANALLLTYGLPALWLWELVRRLPPADADRWRKAGLGVALALAFTLVTLNVRQVFHGAYLDDLKLGNMEVYAYSVAWLAFGLALLFYGALRGDGLFRVASLGIMILTVGKAFLYDARELEGLYRVFSFLGLGASLIGLSWFYTRFVFARGEAPARAEEEAEGRSGASEA
jgi:uncharacterized membrane protein